MSKPKAKVAKPAKKEPTVNLLLKDRERTARQILMASCRAAEADGRNKVKAALRVLTAATTANTLELVLADVRAASYHLTSATLDIGEAISRRCTVTDLIAAKVFEPVKEAK